MVSQVTHDIRPWLLALIHRVALVTDNQNLHRVRFDKQRQSVRHGTDGLPRGVPCHQDASNLRYRAVWRKQDDRPPGLRISDSARPGGPAVWAADFGRATTTSFA